MRIVEIWCQHSGPCRISFAPLIGSVREVLAEPAVAASGFCTTEPAPPARATHDVFQKEHSFFFFAFCFRFEKIFVFT